jgi:hypothetical protein
MKDFCYISVIVVLMAALTVTQRRLDQRHSEIDQLGRLCETSTRLLDARIVEVQALYNRAEVERVRLLGLTTKRLD